MGTVVKHCPFACKSTYQDKKYGQGQRVFNEGKKTTACTVCGKVS